MPKNVQNLNSQLYNNLYARGYDPIPLDSVGDESDEIEKADVFRFSLPYDDKKIPAWLTVEGDELKFYIGNTITKLSYFKDFTNFMKKWAAQRELKWVVDNRDRLIPDMKKRNNMKKKEQLGEAYHPLGKKASYNDAVPTVKIIIQHTRQIQENEQRFRNVEKIFVENVNGERFLLPTKRPGLARVYARHVAEGGTPYDDKGKHITSLVEEYTKMAGFVRATRNGQFNESALQLVNEGLKHYNNLKMTLTSLAGHRGYNKYFESYTPVLNEESEDSSNLIEFFVQEKLDPRIESVMPILTRLSKNITEMSAVKELEEWAVTVTEVEDQTTKTLAEPAEDELNEGRDDLIDSLDEVVMRRIMHSHPELLKDLDNLEMAIADEVAFFVGDGVEEVDSSDVNGIVRAVVSRMSERGVDLDEAPGAETLKHNQDTEKSNLKAFDLEEELKSKMYFVTQKNTNHVVGTWNGEVFKPFDRTKYPAGTMDMIPSDCEVDKVSGPIDKDQYSKVKAVYEKTVEENLDANQKRAGQLGPTEKVGSKGAVGKLVGASESINLEGLLKLSGIK